MRRQLVAGTVLALVIVPVQVTTSAATPEPARPGAAARSSAVLRVDFDDAAEDAPVLTSSGSAAVDISVVSQGAGTLRSVPGRPGADLAGRTPRFADDATGARAVVGVWASDGDPLSPGTEPFTFAADVRLDAGTTSEPGSAAGDNGDNVLQRGRFADVAQYKLQLDHGRPSCRVKGTDGTVMVRGEEVERGDWYTLACDRDGSSLTLTVTHYDGSGDVQSVDTTSETGSIGTVEISSASVPLSIGGKLANDGSLARDGDQFNGRIDNVVLSIG